MRERIRRRSCMSRLLISALSSLIISGGTSPESQLLKIVSRSESVSIPRLWDISSFNRVISKW